VQSEPAAVAAQSVTSVPAIVQPLTPVPPGSPQVPVSAVATDFTQLPLQQALLPMHTSFFCLQNETWLEQVPLMQPPEQHWLSSVHALPEPRHAVPSDWHRPPVQSPLQHCAFVVHAPLVGVSVTHAMLAHAPFTQFPEQQSELTKHASAFE